jgi:ABC-type dipeptide/oligopeptide/nickel transport system permease subunit
LPCTNFQRVLGRTARASLGTGVVAAVIIIIVGIIGGFVGGYILTAIVALIYNWLTPRIGGIKLELE